MDDVNEPERVTFCYFHEHYIEVLWEHVSTPSFLEEVHVCDIIPFEMDILLVASYLALQKRAEPCDEWA